MGSEVYLYLSTGKHSFISRVDAHDTVSVNQELALVFGMKKSHFFDRDTGETIV